MPNPVNRPDRKKPGTARCSGKCTTDKLGRIINSGNVRRDMAGFCYGQSWVSSTTASVVMAGFVEKVNASGISDRASIENMLFRAASEDFRAFIKGTSASHMVSVASDSELWAIRVNIENSLQ